MKRYVCTLLELIIYLSFWFYAFFNLGYIFVYMIGTKIIYTMYMCASYTKYSNFVYMCMIYIYGHILRHIYKYIQKMYIMYTDRHWLSGKQNIIQKISTHLPIIL